jgi:hypothetical protein
MLKQKNYFYSSNELLVFSTCIVGKLFDNDCYASVETAPSGRGSRY